MNERLLKAVDDRVDDLVQLTADLIRFPTVNPPGEAYGPCAEYIGERLRRLGFETEFIRAQGTPGDTDRYPRINVVARRNGRSPGPCVHFNSHIDVVEAGEVTAAAGRVRIEDTEKPAGDVHVLIGEVTSRSIQVVCLQKRSEII